MFLVKPRDSKISKVPLQMTKIILICVGCFHVDPMSKGLTDFISGNKCLNN